MRTQQPTLRPQDIVVLLKIIVLGQETPWSQLTLANDLFMSQSEISQSIARSKYSGLLNVLGKSVNYLSFMEFLQYGIRYIFPQRPGPLVRGVPTAHSAEPLKSLINSEEDYVWPSSKGTNRGHSILPLYPSVIDAVKIDNNLYEMLAMVDTLRVGKSREKEIAVQELKRRILNDK